MEKYREFDLELAKAGHPVQTRNGRKTRIICFDAKDEDYPIIALSEVNGVEEVFRYTSEGKWHIDSDESLDLVMVPEKHEGWINIYYNTDIGERYCDEHIFSTEEEAEKNDGHIYDRVSIIKITWEDSY